MLLATACCNLDRLSRRLLDAAGPTTPAGYDRGGAAGDWARCIVRTFRVWLDDDTPDMARTLAELDRRLQQAETAARWFASFGRFCPRAAKAQATA